MPSPELTRPCGDMADVGWASRAAEGPEGTHAEGAHGHPNDRAGRLAHESPAGIAPPGDRRGPQRRRHRSADKAGPKGSRAACWMRLVVGTNVFVSAALEENSLSFLVARWIDQHDARLKSATTEQQLLDVLRRPHIEPATIPSLREGLARMLAAAELVTIAERIAACRDPIDDKFLQLAVNGHADLIVSRDRDLLALNPFRQIPIVTPAAFVQGVAR